MHNTVHQIREQFAHLLSDEPEYLEIMGAVFQANESTIFGKPNYDYIRRELAWYWSESEYIKDLAAPIPPIWERIADNNGKVSSNYGRRIFNLSYGLQYQQALDELLRDPASRRAVMVYADHNAINEGTYNGRDDQICTMYVSVFIRANYLHYHVHMRSNDAVLGYRNDLAWHMYVRDRLLVDLKHRQQALHLLPATILWFADSLHVYEHDAHLVDDWRKENDPGSC